MLKSAFLKAPNWKYFVEIEAWSHAPLSVIKSRLLKKNSTGIWWPERERAPALTWTTSRFLSLARRTGRSQLVTCWTLSHSADIHRFIYKQTGHRFDVGKPRNVCGRFNQVGIPGPSIHSIFIHGFPKIHGYPYGYPWFLDGSLQLSMQVWISKLIS